MKNERSLCSHRGFTLLEVLVALVIIGLGMMAVFGQLNQSLIAVSTIRDKTFADWIAMNRIAELRLSGEFPKIGEQRDEVKMAGVRWRYRMKVSDVGIDGFRRVDISVSQADNPDRELVTLAGFLARPSDASPANAGRWLPGDPNAR
ncbi:MAG TPA: type II secretion system protein GspI [Chromatiales bacterium]|nr:type II secretion system protein GspI [Chromatiales bacterium]